MNADIQGLFTELKGLLKKQNIAMRDRQIRGRDGICFPTTTSRRDALSQLAKEAGEEVFEP